MLKGKLKLPEKTKLVFPDRLGSLVAGFENKAEENGGSDPVFDSGEELEMILPNGYGSGRESQIDEEDEDFDDEKLDREPDLRVQQRPEREGSGSLSVLAAIAADDKRSDLEYELSQPEINLEKLQRIASSGLPDGGGLRATAWKLLLGYLPPSRDLWEKELIENRQKYAKLKEELLLSPSQITKRKIGDLSYCDQPADGTVDGPLKRCEISEEDHPLSLGKASVWHQYFQHTEIAEQIDRDLQRTHPDLKFFSGESSFSRKHRESMRSILLLFAKLNPAIRYVQGMNEVLAPIYYVFSTDPNEQNAVNAEADGFSCFVRLLSDSVDHFCEQLDNSAVGILSTLSRLSELLKANDEELWRHLEFTTKVKPQYYGFRWITLLLTQEFNFQTILRIWDSLLSSPFGVQDMLLKVCCAMLLCVKSRLLSGDFVANLKLLQRYPDINIEHLLQLLARLRFADTVREIDMVAKPVLLHGILHATIYEVDRLMPGGCCIFFCKFLGESVGLEEGSRLYATIDLENVRVGRTRLLENSTKNPQWRESFHIYCAHMTSNVVFSIREDKAFGAKVIGRAYMPAAELLNGKEVDRWLKIMHHNNKPLHRRSKIHVKLQFFNVNQDLNWSCGIRSPEFRGVPYTFFTQRNGCRVTLYQNADVPKNFTPKIPLAGSMCYDQHRCWEDIFHAISNAKHLIYIAGWSVYTKITLVRDPNSQMPGGDLTLGELLKKKADEGVKVLMLVWDDRTSVKLLKRDGVMATHDEDTESYFHNTAVHCVLCPRNPDNGNSIVEDLEVSTMFTHHQKTVVVDSDLPNGEGLEKRRIVSFIGGIDLCDGRYDTPSHPIFRTLDTTHKNDFHQPNFEGASIAKGGPRDPWHDIHCRLEGPIAWDVLFNFEQRWRKQGGKDLLVELTELDDTFIPPSPVMFPQDHETWTVQLFRSIDGGAAFGFPDSPEDAARAGLVTGKDHMIERSIQDAYINAIRRAKSFIYIENQYFLGSSFGWHSDYDTLKVEKVGALHLIPKELSLKIVSKIEAGERFTVYIVMPMWPEGIPEKQTVQAILHWQRMTMDMMYRDIVQALKAKGIEANPKDYLAFFCLGNREKKLPGEYEPPEKPEPGSDYSRAQQARRFMIYVHAKMMIVDDEYIIIGSANINQRSMDGARDSEIAMGAYQPYHLSTGKPARGQIHGLRMSLWYEHLGLLDDTFLEPENVECFRKVNQIADQHWELYSCDTLDGDLPGHLLSYPIAVTEDGEVTELPGTEFFPDTKARILGSKSDLLPSILTT